jgi:hypothetical protein
MAEFSSAFARWSSVLSGGELSSKDKSRSVCWVGVCGGEAAEVRLCGSLSSTDIGYNGAKPAPRHLLRMLLPVRALLLARMHILTHTTEDMRPVSSRRAASVSEASARLIRM